MANRLRELPSPLFCLGGASSPGSCGGPVDYRVLDTVKEETKARAAGDEHDIEQAVQRRVAAEQECAKTSRAKAEGGTCRPHLQKNRAT